ncbi:MAG TPA: NAD(P)/FAD-dependent oxidoreductase, partial [Deinococcales bacterium]|nr:NAD(P)/FAD-dependent oxidoreductase [Deinococcales bacterium]
AWLAAQSGPAPSEMGAGGFLMWHAALHDRGAKRAVGGSGALSEALANRLRSLGGEVFLDAPVERIEGQRGRAARVVLRDGRAFTGRVVVSGAHVQTTMLDLLAPRLLPAGLRMKVSEIRVGNGFGLMHRLATPAAPAHEGAPPEAHAAMHLLCPTLEQLEGAYLDYLRGVPSRQPGVIAMSFSGLDPTLAPPGKHLVYLWAQYYPFLRSDGRDWADPQAVAEEAANVEEVLYRSSPNLRGRVEQRFTQSPLDLQERIGLKNGNVMHVEMGLDQLFSLRPTPELSGYRTPVPGLYLTGASMHPGGGVFAASGRATAKVVLHDLAGGYTGKAVGAARRALTALSSPRPA